MSHYIQLYSGNVIQDGRGSSIRVYRGPLHHHQRGAGIGNFLLSTFNYLKPLLHSGVNVLADEGIKSSKAVLSQLGQKDLPTILNEERANILNNLKKRAISKLDHMSGKMKKSQSGQGVRKKKKSIKTPAKVKKAGIIKTSKVGHTSTISMKAKQIGKGKKGKKKCKSKNQKGKGKSAPQSGGKRKKSSQSGNGKKSKKVQKRDLDIFDN